MPQPYDNTDIIIVTPTQVGLGSERVTLKLEATLDSPPALIREAWQQQTGQEVVAVRQLLNGSGLDVRVRLTVTDKNGSRWTGRSESTPVAGGAPAEAGPNPPRWNWTGGNGIEVQLEVEAKFGHEDLDTVVWQGSKPDHFMLEVGKGRKQYAFGEISLAFSGVAFRPTSARPSSASALA